MGRPDEVAARVLEGFTPEEIAVELGLSHNSVLGYLDRAVGEGLLRRSDIYFALPPDVRRSPATFEDREVVRRFGDAGHAMGDLYDDLRSIECALHRTISSALQEHYGFQESEWWRQGVPERIRKKCQERREEDPRRLDPYRYTDLLDMREIVEANWSVVGRELGRFSSDRRQLREQLERLNTIRRMVMHPVRGIDPDEDDFQFTRNLKRDLRI